MVAAPVIVVEIIDIVVSRRYFSHETLVLSLRDITLIACVLVLAPETVLCDQRSPIEESHSVLLPLIDFLRR